MAETWLAIKILKYVGDKERTYEQIVSNFIETNPSQKVIETVARLHAEGKLTSTDSNGWRRTK